MEPSKIKMLLHDDVMYQILLRLPVISLSRFKLVCKSWRALIESSYFIGDHLHLHHYDHSLKDKNRNLLYLLRGKDSPVSFPLASIESFEEPKVCLELNCSDLHGCFPLEVLKTVSCNGIICLHLLNCKREHYICLWNPAINRSRVLPRSAFHDNITLTIGFGYDIKTNDYKVVKLIRGSFSAKRRRYEVYSLNTGSWRSLTRGFSVCLFGYIGMPFNSGTCFFWGYVSSKNCTPMNNGILCFDFISEMFRCISLPPGADCYSTFPHVDVVNDKIACVLKMYIPQTELWVLNEYGRASESWTKLYTVDTSPIRDERLYIGIKGFSTNGSYIFFKTKEQMCRFNVVTKETKYFTHENMPWPYKKTLVEFKESLVSVGEGNNAPICINKDSGNQK